MVDLRLYRVCFLPAILAVIALLFSLQSQPSPLRGLVSPAGFERSTAVRYTNQLLAAAPSRSPGSTGDLRAAGMVERTFHRISSGHVLVQRFGDGGSLRNVILKLPGQSTHVIVLMAPRDTATGTGAASSAAATGTLEALASSIGTAQHSKTILLVSTDGSSQGSTGASVLASNLLAGDTVDGIVALEAPGGIAPQQPYLLTSSTDAGSTASQLVRTAETSLEREAGLHSRQPGPFGQLAELALPGGLGEQAVLISRGYEAIGLSSVGEQPLEPTSQFSPHTMELFGLTAFDLVLALDSVSSAPVHGPGSYLQVSGNLVPGWALAALALALLLPALVAAVDAVARSARRGTSSSALSWVALRLPPLLAALLVLYLLALIGIVPRPSFPFDPAAYSLGLTELLAIALLVLIAGAVWWRLGRNRIPVRLLPQAGASASGLYSTVALFAIWVLNPYLALLLVPLGHPWLLQARPARRPGRGRVAIAVAIALLPLALGALSLIGRLDLGGALSWQLVLTIGDGGISAPLAVLGCVLAGSLGALLVVAGAGAYAGPPAPLRPQQSGVETPETPVPDAAQAPDWTDNRSGSGLDEPIYGTAEGNRRPREDGDRIAPAEWSRALARSDQFRELPRGPGRGRPRDAEEGEPDQARPDRARRS